MESTSLSPKNKYVIILGVFLLLSLIVNVAMYSHYQHKFAAKFDHLSPDIAWLEVGEFIKVQNKYSVQFQEMRQELEGIIEQSGRNGTYGVYFEDLQTGAWIGINEREQFISASLLKVPVLVAILRKVEDGELNLDEKVVVGQDDLNFASGTLAEKGAGYVITVRELLVYLIKESDNTALSVLQTRFLTAEEVLEARLAMGLPIEGNQIVSLGPKHYSNILRSLYYSAYLKRSSSELALSIMSETDYNSQIPAGVPGNIPVSHKVGYIYTEGQYHFHDCGIIYHPVKPYILCIMTKGANQQEADSAMSNLSGTVYGYVDDLASD